MGFLLLGLVGLGLTAFAVNSFTNNDDDDDGPDRPEEPVDPVDPVGPVAPDTTIYGTPGDDDMDGANNDVLAGRAGDDDIRLTDSAVGRGNAGQDTLYGDGNSALFGNLGHDRLTATEGATAYGGSGGDNLTTTRGSVGYGGFGSDSFNTSDFGTAFGGAGDDRIALNVFGNFYGGAVGHGGAGADHFFAGGDALAYGGIGSDTLFGSLDMSSDSVIGPTLSGGLGRDLFIAEIDRGSDEPITITDFDPARDRLAVTPGPYLGGESAFETGLRGFDTVAGDGYVDLVVRFEQQDRGGLSDVTQTIRLEGVTEFDPATVRVAVQNNGEYTLMDLVRGGPGDNSLAPDSPVFVRLGQGDDQFTSGGDVHYAYGGTGDDLFTGPDTASDATEGSVLSLGHGDDTLTGAMGGQMIDGGAGDDSLTLASGDASAGLFTWVTGGAGDDVITVTGTDASLGTIDGGTGSDTISANVGQGYVALDELVAETDELTLLLTPAQAGDPVPHTQITGNDADQVIIDSAGFDGTLHQVNRIITTDLGSDTEYALRVQYVFIDAAADPATVLAALAGGATDGVAGLAGIVTLHDTTATVEGEPPLGGGRPVVDDFDVPAAVLDRAIASVSTSYIVQ